MKALRRYLATEGLSGEMPAWYLLVSAARYLKVAPWDLARQPAWWTNVAIAAQSAENSANKLKRKVGHDANGG